VGDTQISLYDSLGRPSGVIVGNIDAIRSVLAPPSVVEFSPDATTFVAGSIVPQPTIGVEGISLDDDSVLSGDIWLVGEDGVVLKHNNNDVRVHVVGDRLFARRSCEEEEGAYRVPRPLRRIVIRIAGLGLAISSLTDEQIAELTLEELELLLLEGDEYSLEIELTPDQYGNIDIVPDDIQGPGSIIRIVRLESGLRISIISNFD
jgi:hypothetical protein